VAFEWIDLQSAEGRALAALIETLQYEGAALNSAALIEHFRDTEHSIWLNAARSENLDQGLEGDDVAVVFDHTVAKMKQRMQRTRARELGAKIKSGAATEQEKREFVDLSKRQTAADALASPAEDPI
jgi:hypothetical protein